MEDDSPSNSASITVLHVDEEPTITDLTADFLQKTDHSLRVEAVEGGSEALNILAEKEIDCVLSDYKMPDMDGLALLEAVRSRDPDLPFIIFTNKGSEAVASEAISAGVTDYFQKEMTQERFDILANRIVHAVERMRTERAQRRQMDAIETAQEGISILDASGEFLYVNEAYAAIYGYEPAELIGEHWTLLYPSDEIERVEAEISPALEATGIWQGETTGIRADGTRIIEDHRLALTDQDEIVCTIRDITEEAKKRREEETLIDNLPGIVYRCRNETDWPIENVRGEVETLTGYPPSELIERNGLYGREIIHPEDRDDVWETVQQAIDAGESFELTYRIQTKGNEDKWVWERGQAVIGKDGTVEAIEGFITDISDKETIARNLRHEREFIQQALDSLSEVFYVLSPDGDLLRWNERVLEVTGYSAAELEGMDGLQLFPEHERDRILEAIEETLTEGEAVIESQVLTKSGETIPYEFTGATLTDSEGNITNLVGIGRDITVRKNRQDRLERQNRQLEEFAKIISHDLRNPLNVAKGRVDLAREDGNIEHLRPAAEALERTQVLLDDLQTLAKEGKTIGATETVSISEVAEGCWETVRTGSARLSVQEDVHIEADRSRLEQLFENLFRNAVEHGGEDVRITVGATSNGFYVEDDGPGVPLEEREAVFDSGYTVADVGSGLGLAIVREIASAHEWEVSLAESVDGGARFEFRNLETPVPSESKTNH